MEYMAVKYMIYYDMIFYPHIVHKCKTIHIVYVCIWNMRPNETSTAITTCKSSTQGDLWYQIL
jgi:hypothetical protein